MTLMSETIRYLTVDYLSMTTEEHNYVSFYESPQLLLSAQIGRRSAW